MNAKLWRARLNYWQALFRRELFYVGAFLRSLR